MADSGFSQRGAKMEFAFSAPWIFRGPYKIRPISLLHSINVLFWSPKRTPWWQKRVRFLDPREVPWPQGLSSWSTTESSACRSKQWCRRVGQSGVRRVIKILPVFLRRARHVLTNRVPVDPICDARNVMARPSVITPNKYPLAQQWVTEWNANQMWLGQSHFTYGQFQNKV